MSQDEPKESEGRVVESVRAPQGPPGVLLATPAQRPMSARQYVQLLSIGVFTFIAFSVLPRWFTVVYLTFLFTYASTALVDRVSRVLRLEARVVGRVFATGAVLGSIALGAYSSVAIVPFLEEQGNRLIAELLRESDEHTRRNLLRSTVGRIRVRAWSLLHPQDYQQKLKAFCQNLDAECTRDFQAKQQRAAQVKDEFETETKKRLGEEALRFHQSTDQIDKHRTNALKEQDKWFASARLYLQSNRDAADELLKKKWGDEWFAGLSRKRRMDRYEAFRRARAPAAEAVVPADAWVPDSLEMLEQFCDPTFSVERFKARYSGNAESVRTLFEAEEEESRVKDIAPAQWSSFVDDFQKRGLHLSTEVGTSLLRLMVDALLALILTLVLIWKLPTIQEDLDHRAANNPNVARLRAQFGPVLGQFADTMARGFLAQLLVAVINAAATYVLLYLCTSLKYKTLLALIVLLCSLVPYFGTFLAAVPLCGYAAQVAGAGVALKVFAILFAVHSLESWVLTPRIVGKILELDFTVMFVVLFVAAPVFGVWGFILGPPLVSFLLSYSRNEDQTGDA